MLMCFDKNNLFRDTHKKIKEEYERIDKDYQNLINVLLAFEDKIPMPINREDLDLFPELEWIDLNDKVSIRKRKNLFNNYLNFDTKLQKGGAFGEHFHDDMIENAEVINGKMIDQYDGKVYEQHDIMHYEKGEKHKPVALKETLLKVIFKP